MSRITSRLPAFTLAVMAFVAPVLGQQEAPAVGDLGAVINLMKDPGSTALQEQGLVGKMYSGVVTVEEVSVSPTDKSIGFIDVDLGRQVVDNRVVAFIKMRFLAKANDEKVLQLRKGKATLRGTLKNFTTVQSRYLGVEPTKWANFTDAVVETANR